MIVSHNDPVVADAVAVRLLSGLSGARVYLMTQDGRRWFVRKAAAQADGSPRLRRQAEKQKAWLAHGDDLVRTPRILHEGEIEGRYFFDMDAVRGVDGVTYLRSADYDGVKEFTNRLCRYLTQVAAAPPLCDSTSRDLFDALFSRICAVQAATSRLGSDDAAAVLLGLERVRKHGNLPPTWCHGDMTLENILVDEQGGIWAFDLLDAPYEHYWQDVAKLHQDLEGGWYLRHQPPIARCVTEFVGRRLQETTVQLDPDYAVLHPVLMAATFIRILPYVHEAAAIRFVLERVGYYAGLLRDASR